MDLDKKIPHCFNLLSIINDKIVLNEDASRHFSHYTGPISIVSVCGDYRTGKSYLLNILFPQNSFSVSSTTEPCTKGININNSPIHYNGKNIWILDSQGFGSITQDGDYDGKIFLLCMLLSQVLIFNTIGSIDENSVNKMGLICKKAQDVLFKRTNEQPLMNKAQLYWILRDFALQLKNKEGIKINSDQYLQQSLREYNDNLNFDRKIIKKYFGSRRCFPLVRPCISQQSLQNLKEASPKQLRSEFLIEAMKIKMSILSNIRNKQVQGRDINGEQFIDLLKYFVEYLNQDTFKPGLTVSWDKILLNKRQEVLYRIEENFDQKIKSYYPMMPLEKKEVHKVIQKLENIKEKTIKELSDHHSSCRQFMRKLQDIKRKYVQQLKQKNNQRIRQDCQKFLHDWLRQFESLCRIEDIPTFLDEGEKKIQRGKKIYENQFIQFSRPIASYSFTLYLQKVFKYFIKQTKRLWASHQQFKNKEIKELVNEKGNLMVELQQVLQLQLKFKGQLESIRPKYEESAALNQHFEGIIQRMEKLNGSLEQQLRLSQRELNEGRESWNHHKKQLEENNALLNIKIIERTKQIQQLLAQRNCQQNKIHTLQNALSVNSKQHTSSMNRINKQSNELLISQREQFEAILFEKNVRQMQLFQQIEQSRKASQDQATEIQHLRLERIEFSHKEAEQRILQRHSFQSIIRQLKIQGQQAEEQRKSLEEKIQILQASIKEEKSYVKSLEKRENQMVKQKQTHESALKQKIVLKQKEIEELKQKHSQFIGKIQLLSSEIREEKSQSKAQTEAMKKRLEEGLSKFAASSQQKYELTKKEYELQQEKVSNKLIEAAERIERLGENEKSLTLKVKQQQQEIGMLRGEIEKQKFWGNKNNSILEQKIWEAEKAQEQVFRNNSKLKQVISLQKKQIQKWQSKYEEIRRQKRSDEESWQGKGKQQEIWRRGSCKKKKQIESNKQERQNDGNQGIEKRQLFKTRQGLNLFNTHKFESKSFEAEQQKKREVKNMEYQKEILNLHKMNKLLNEENEQLKLNIQSLQSKSNKFAKFSFKQANLHVIHKQLLRNKPQEDPIRAADLKSLHVQTEKIQNRDIPAQLIEDLNKLNEILLQKDAYILQLQNQLQEKELELSSSEKEKSDIADSLQEKVIELEGIRSKLEREIVRVGKQVDQHRWKKRVWKARIVQLEMRQKQRAEQKSKFYGSKIDLMFNSL